MRAVVQALMLEHGLLCVRRAEPKPLSKRRRVESFAFRPSARFWFPRAVLSTCFCARSKCSAARSVYSGADSVCSGTCECRMSVLLSGALCSTGAGRVRFRRSLLRSVGRSVGRAVLD